MRPMQMLATRAVDIGLDIPEPKSWGIRDFANLFDVTPRTIRFYEDKGLISPKRETGTRVFGPVDYIRTRRIMQAKRNGFSLDDIAEVFEVLDGEITSRDELLARKENFERVIRALQRRRKDIKIITSELTELCQQIDVVTQNMDHTDPAVFKHAAAYERVLSQSFDDDVFQNEGDDTSQQKHSHT
ncbi:MAG: MerR family transcriptional regulator [Maricaulaceae bacterium]